MYFILFFDVSKEYTGDFGLWLTKKRVLLTSFFSPQLLQILLESECSLLSGFWFPFSFSFLPSSLNVNMLVLVPEKVISLSPSSNEKEDFDNCFLLFLRASRFVIAVSRLLSATVIFFVSSFVSSGLSKIYYYFMFFLPKFSKIYFFSQFIFEKLEIIIIKNASQKKKTCRKK